MVPRIDHDTSENNDDFVVQTIDEAGPLTQLWEGTFLEELTTLVDDV